MNYVTELGRALKYLTEREDFIKPTMVGQHSDLLPHKMFADYLMDSPNPADTEVGGLLAQEVDKSEKGHRLGLVRLGDGATMHDTIRAALASAHPNPTVRAYAKHIARQPAGAAPPHDLFSILLSSERPHDQDAGVYLHPEDHHSTHSAHRTLAHLNSQPFAESGLEAKVVRGTVYLMDHEDVSNPTWGAPSIVFTAPVNDPSELAEMRAHAEQIVAERNVDDGPAQIGPLH